MARSAPQQPSETFPPAVGIDFGTTKSAIGVCEGGDVRLIPNAEGAFTTPSLVAITAEGEILVGTAAMRQAITNPDYTVRSAKLRLGTGWSITRGSVRLTAEDIAAHVLARLRADAEAHIGGPPAAAVLTVPASFDLVQRAALIEAAARAGLRVDRLINEPSAAAITYGLGKETDTTALVFDLGGGALDVSVIEFGDGVVEVRATSGDNRLGGDDWDRRIVQHLVRRVWDRYGVDLTHDTPAMRRLQEAAETARVQLSSASAATVTLPYLSSGPHGPLHLDESLTRQDFEALTRDLLERCRRTVEQAVRDAGVRPSELDQVLLTGGATRMPAVGELVRHLTNGGHPSRGLIPEGVVTGAALQSGILVGAVKDVLLLDVVSASLVIETHEGTVKTMVDRNHTIPTRRREYFAPSANNQTTMVLHLLEGEAKTSSGNRTLAVLELSGLPPHPRRTPLIAVTVDIDARGLLHLNARELRGSTAQLPAQIKELGRAGQEPPGALDADYFTGREWTVVVNRASTEQAAAVVKSPRWAALRDLTPLAWEPPNPPDPS